MAIYTSFIVATPRVLDETRKKAQKKKLDLRELLGDADVDLDWRDTFAQAFLKHLVSELVKDSLERESFMSTPLHAPGYVLFSTPDALVEGLASLTAPRRAKLVASAVAEGFTHAARSLEALEPLAKRASAGGKNLYFCIHIP